MSGPAQRCIGNAFYAEFDGYGITFATNCGWIYLEPAVWSQLTAFAERCWLPVSGGQSS